MIEGKGRFWTFAPIKAILRVIIVSYKQNLQQTTKSHYPREMG